MKIEFGTTFFGLLTSGVVETNLATRVIVLSLQVLFFQTRFCFEDFENFVFLTCFCLLDDTFDFESRVLKLVPSDFAIKTDKHSYERCSDRCRAYF